MDFQEQCRLQHRSMTYIRSHRSYAQGTLPLLLRVFTKQTPQGYLLQCPEEMPRNVFIKSTHYILSTMQATAVILTADGRSLNSNLFAQRFGLSIDADFSRNYLRILNEQFDGTMANLPTDLWQDSITTVVKGPHFLSFGCYCIYTLQGEDGVAFQPVIEISEQKGIMDFGILPDWWQTPLQ